MSTVSSTTSTTNPYLIPYSSSDISGTDSTAGKYTTSSSGKSSSSSSSGSYSQSLIGEMTGLDVTNMVNESMQSDVIKLNSLLAKQQVSQWQQDRYRSVITNLQDFSSKYFDILSDDYILSDSAFSVNTATPTNTNVVSTSASNAAKTGAYTITSAALATAAKVTSDVLKNTSGTKPAASDAISTLGVTSGTLSFSVGGQSVNYNLSATSTISSVMSDLSSASGLNFNYSELTGKFSISTQKTGDGQNVNITNVSDDSSFFSKFGINASGGISTASESARIDGSAVINNGTNFAAATDAISATNLGLANGRTISFSSNGTSKTYTIDTSKSINTLMSDLTTLTGSAFSYDASTGKVSVARTGSSSLDINYGNATSDSNTYNFFNNVLGITSTAGAGSTVDIVQTSSVATGHNGSFAIQEPGDSSVTTVSKASNNFTIDGVSYSFSSGFDSTKATNSDPVVTINVNQDVTSAVSKIQNFVTDYNNLIDGINTVVTEKRDYDYKPLTSAQESQMTASQIAAWNQKAQQGLLGNDGNLSDILSSMRAAFYTPVNGNGLTMASVGLSTSNDPSQGGKLTFNAKTLTTALQNNPQQVVELFTKASTSYSTYETASDSGNSAVATRNSEEGIFQRLSDIEKKYAGTYVDKSGNQGILLMKAGMPGTVSETKNALYKQLTDEAKSVSDFKDKITSDATMYNTKFTNLQTILTQLSSQQNALSSMLGTSS